MLSQRFYYGLKPYLPWRLRIALRRIVAQRLRRNVGSTWPINEGAGHTPDDWPGWPDNKRFAVVLTHDVEGKRGLARCRALADLEKASGFRSSFNFIPEGEYHTPEALRRQLTEEGFEVGVHDLKHDGKLYNHRESFRRGAERINGYLRQWGAVGFRSGFMRHNYEWLHDLQVQYDASTFDTDPFEPQPDGANTIFPFWVPRDQGTKLNAAAGYVELPYTLPQDSTLYLVLEETTGQIWRRKVDWLAERGGMVLVNVHPDYLHYRVGGRGRASVEDHYRDLLHYLKETYGGSYWHALPRDISAFVRTWKFRSDMVDHAQS